MRNYQPQVALLLTVLPEVAKEKSFALHGGTAINLFVRDMPRLSVDIDLTYIPLEERGTSFTNISTGLLRIKEAIESVDQTIQIVHKEKELKLLIAKGHSQIKIEVSQAMRGVIDPAIEMTLCEKAQTEFDAFCSIQVIPIGQLYGGKICAALDRQHPRDLFDVKYLLENEGFNNEVKKGFLFSLLGSKRPFHEMLQPHLLEQRMAMENQFEGMTEEPFTYEDFESTRNALVKTIHDNLALNDKNFLLSFADATPDWGVYNFEKFPAVQWKLQNLQNLKRTNTAKHRGQIELLSEVLKIDS